MYMEYSYTTMYIGRSIGQKAPIRPGLPVLYGKKVTLACAWAEIRTKAMCLIVKNWN